MLNGSSTRSSLRLLLDTPHRRGYFPTYGAFRHGVAGAQREQPAEVTGRRLPEEDRGGGRTSPSFPVLERIALALHATLDVSLPRKGGRHGRQGRHLEGGVLARRGSQGPSKAETGGHGQGRQESGGARSNQDRCQAGGRRYVHLRSPQGR